MESKGTTVIEGAEEKVEEAELDAYLDAERMGDDGPSHKDRVDYAKARYAQIIATYKGMVMQIEELDGRGRKDEALKVREAVRENYKARKWAVKTLRALGEKVDDRFVPG